MLTRLWRTLCVPLISAICVGVVGCGAVSDRSQAATVIVVATATSNEPAAQLPVGIDEVLGAANASRQGTVTLLMPVDGRAEQIGEVVQVRVLRDGTDFENDPELVEQGLADIASDVRARVASLGSNEPVLDLLTGLAEAARRSPQSTIVVLSSGLQTTGLVDFVGLGWDFDNSAVVENLRAKGFLPDLTGKEVLFVGLGDTAGTAQLPLPDPTRAKLESLWLDICRAGGAQKCGTARRESTAPVVSTTPARVVEVPLFVLPPLPEQGDVDVPIPTDALFAPDSAELLPQADTQLATLAAEFKALRATVDLTGHTWSVGPADSARVLSLQRAQAVEDALLRHGMPAELIGTVTGVGYDQIIRPPGADAEQTAAANRVVVVTVRMGG